MGAPTSAYSQFRIGRLLMSRNDPVAIMMMSTIHPMPRHPAVSNQTIPVPTLTA